MAINQSKSKDIFSLSGNALKLMALVFMTIDHAGMYIFDNNIYMRIIGRLAFPIFAYMISEGCKYTKSKARYLITMLLFAIVCQAVTSWATRTLYMCIFVTFSLSILLIFSYDYMIKKRTLWSFWLFFVTLSAIIVLTEVLTRILPENLYYDIDYGIFGILCPFLVYLGFNKATKLALCAVGLIFLSLTSGYVQWFCLFALIPLCLYNGKRGKLKLKYLFYIYYPLHIAIIYQIAYYVWRL